MEPQGAVRHLQATLTFAASRAKRVSGCSGCRLNIGIAFRVTDRGPHQRPARVSSYQSIRYEMRSGLIILALVLVALSYHHAG